MQSIDENDAKTARSLLPLTWGIDCVFDLVDCVFIYMK